MKKIILLFLIAICSQLAFGRNITGKVISEADSTAIVGAVCKLQAGDKVLEAVTSDLNGCFSMSTLDKSAITLEVSMVGYNPTDE